MQQGKRKPAVRSPSHSPVGTRMTTACVEAQRRAAAASVAAVQARAAAAVLPEEGAVPSSKSARTSPKGQRVVPVGRLSAPPTPRRVTRTPRLSPRPVAISGIGAYRGDPRRHHSSSLVDLQGYDHLGPPGTRRMPLSRNASTSYLPASPAAADPGQAPPPRAGAEAERAPPSTPPVPAGAPATPSRPTALPTTLPTGDPNVAATHSVASCSGTTTPTEPGSAEASSRFGLGGAPGSAGRQRGDAKLPHQQTADSRIMKLIGRRTSLRRSGSTAAARTVLGHGPVAAEISQRRRERQQRSPLASSGGAMAPRTGSAATTGSASISKVRYGPPMASGSASTSAAPPRQPGPSSPPGVVVTTPPAQSRSLAGGKRRQTHDGAISPGEHHAPAPNLPESINAGLEAAAALNDMLAAEAGGDVATDAATGAAAAPAAATADVESSPLNGGVAQAARPSPSAAVGREVQPATLVTGTGGPSAGGAAARGMTLVSAPAPGSVAGAASVDAVGSPAAFVWSSSGAGERSDAVVAKRELLGELVEQLAARAYQSEQALSSEQRANRALRVTLEALQRQNECLQQQVALLAQSYQGAGLGADGAGLVGMAS